MARNTKTAADEKYSSILGDISDVIDAARSSAVRSVNCIMTAAYWLIGQRVVEFEQRGKKRAEYGEELLERLSADLKKRYGRGFSRQNLQQMRQFYLLYPPEKIRQTPSGELEQITTVGLILCAHKNDAVARYALEGLHNKVMAAEYRTALPDEKKLAAEINRTRKLLQDR